MGRQKTTIHFTSFSNFAEGKIGNKTLRKSTFWQILAYISDLRKPWKNCGILDTIKIAIDPLGPPPLPKFGHIDNKRFRVRVWLCNDKVWQSMTPYDYTFVSI